LWEKTGKTPGLGLPRGTLVKVKAKRDTPTRKP